MHHPTGDYGGPTRPSHFHHETAIEGMVMEGMEGEVTAKVDGTADRLEGTDAGYPAPVEYTPEQEELRLHGLRILARMIVKAYLRDQHELPNTLAAVQTRSQEPLSDVHAT